MLRRWVPLTAAATFVLAVAAVFAMGLTDKAQALAFQATIDHVKCSRFNMTPAAADPVAAAEHWHGRFGWPIKVPASASETRLELKAVRRCAVTDGRVAHLMYLWDGEPLSVYVLPSKVVDSAELVHRFGHDALIWSQNGRTYIMIGRRLREPSVDAAVAYVRANVY